MWHGAGSRAWWISQTESVAGSARANFEQWMGALNVDKWNTMNHSSLFSRLSYLP